MQRHLNMIPSRAYIKFLEARNTQRNLKNTMNCMRKTSIEQLEDSWKTRDLNYE